ncbi:MAG: transposase, partial [Selenomonadaceae bacterium]|nr:transposase [Selenomonadaceae bacterium]
MDYLPKGNAYIKYILSRKIQPYKSTAGNNQATWRDLPPQFGNWNSIYHKFRQWCADDVFEDILKAMVADTEKYLLVQIDSTFCKVHQHATGARKIFGNQAIGISRGGKNTKIHALVTENFQLIGLILSGGDIRDFILSQKAQVCIP